MLGAAGVQIPQNNLGNLQLIREEEDGVTEVLDPRDVPGSILLAVIDFAALVLLLGTDLGTLGLLVYTLVTTCLGETTSRGMGTLRGTLLVVVILVKGHAFPTKVKVLPTFLESEFCLFNLDLTFLDWTSTLFFSLLLGVREILSFFVLPEGFDPLALVEGFTHVEDNKGLLVTLGMLLDDATVSANRTIFFLLIGVTATNFSLGL
ncbi:hypothetical protein Tco_0184910 [Tanacetum coccineum]